MSCIGTAGHVDHGKSTLVHALTGIDPDRLVEEKERGMTIDIGFAWLKLPSGREVSIVDVPGHESFIKNMLAGVGGIDAALLVIAADEGVMPQTREHLAILDLLRVPRGVVALTKADLVDEEWLELVKEEVAELLKPTTLSDAAILPVSAYTKRGLIELLVQLDRIVDESPGRKNIARPRLPVDRVFTMTGFGTVVTGTLIDGTIKIGQEVEVLPQAMSARVRGIQTHKQPVEIAQPGSRVALNLANVARTDLQRGNVVILPGQAQTTLLIDARVHVLDDANRSLTHNTRVDFYCGSQEVSARVRLLDTQELLPGEDAWTQLRLSRPVVVAHRDRFILRIASPSMTIGGGEIVDVHPRYHRRFQPIILDSLARLAHGTPEELVLAALDRRYSARKAVQGLIGYELQELVRQANLSEDVTQRTLETLLKEERVYRIGSVWFAQPIWQELVEEAVRLVSEQHQNYPLRSGLSKEEWRARLKLSQKLASEILNILQTEGRLETVNLSMSEREIGYMAVSEAGARSGSLLRLPGFTPRFTAVQQQQVARLLQRFRTSLYTPPGRAEAEMIVGPEVLNALIDQGQFVKLGDGILFLRETYDEAVKKLVLYMHDHGTMTVAEARDVLGATRKYILPLLEHMDALRITWRAGDARLLGPIDTGIAKIAEAN